jgi:hypothetical protein
VRKFLPGHSKQAPLVMPVEMFEEELGSVPSDEPGHTELVYLIKKEIYFLSLNLYF